MSGKCSIPNCPYETKIESPVEVTPAPPTVEDVEANDVFTEEVVEEKEAGTFEPRRNTQQPEGKVKVMVRL